MQQRVSLEIKVGAFIVGGVVLLVIFLFAIGDLATYFQPGYGLRVIFDSAIGISRGSPVQYAGVEVGKVEDVRIVYPDERAAPKVELLVRLPRDVKVYSDDEASISTFGLLGEKYLEIMPGPGAGARLQPSEILIGKPPIKEGYSYHNKKCALPKKITQKRHSIEQNVAETENRIRRK